MYVKPEPPADFLELPDTVRIEMHTLLTDKSTTFAEKKHQFIHTFKQPSELIDDIINYYEDITMSFNESKVFLLLHG